MKPITKTIFTILTILILAAIGFIAVTSLRPDVDNDLPPEGDDTDIQVYIIVANLDGEKLLSGEVSVQSGSLEFVIDQFILEHDNFSVESSQSEYGVMYSSFTVEGETYGGGTVYVFLYSDDASSTTSEWGSKTVEGVTYFALSLGATDTQVVDEATYVISVGTYG